MQTVETLKHAEQKRSRIARDVIGATLIVAGLASFAVGAAYTSIAYNNVDKQADSKYPPVSDKAVEAANNEITLFDQKINQSMAQGKSLSSALTSEEAEKFNQDEQILTETAQRDEYDTQLSAKSIKEKLASIGMPLGFVIAMGGLVTSVTKSKR